MLRHTTLRTPAAAAASMTLWLPWTLVFTACCGKNSHDGTCLSAAAWKTIVDANERFGHAAVVANVAEEEPQSRVGEPAPHVVLLGLVSGEDVDRSTPRSSRCPTIVEPNDPVPPVMATVEPCIRSEITPLPSISLPP